MASKIVQLVSIPSYAKIYAQYRTKDETIIKERCVFVALCEDGDTYFAVNDEFGYLSDPNNIHNFVGYEEIYEDEEEEAT